MAVAFLFSRLTLYSLPETPQQVVEVISLPLLEQKPQSPPQQQRVERRTQREPKREKIERKTQEKLPQQPQKAQEQKLKEEPKRETPVQERPVAQEVKPLTTQEVGTRETPREEKRITGGEAHGQVEAPHSGGAQRQEVAPRERVESPPQVQEKKSTSSPPADQLSRYFALVKGIIESKKRYPEEAKRRGEEGTVVVSFTIDESGNPVNVKLVSSSGSPSIDNETLRLIRSLKFPPPPDGKPVNLRVEVEYQLRR
ncbi:MAG: energy transducer TonB [Thermocrinis sp.]|nr:energy transducer TonB [Thermocrinis sp.]